MKRHAGVSYTGSEIINVHKTKEQREHNKTLFPNPNQNNNGSFVRYMKVYPHKPIIYYEEYFQEYFQSKLDRKIRKFNLSRKNNILVYKKECLICSI